PQDWESLDELFEQHQEIRIFESVEKVIPEDLVEKTEWSVSFKDFTRMSCENLYTSLSPKKFLALLEHKEKLGPELIDLCSSALVQAGLSVSWLLNKEFAPEEQT